MHRIILILLGILICSTVEVTAQQTASVSGYVTDSETGETLISANIGFQGTRLGASTNTLGYYTITNIEPGTYTLIASYIGYQSYSRQITLEPGENLRLDIDLIPESIELEEIEVRSQAELEEQKNIGTAQVNTELIKELPSVFEADVFRSVQLLPGVKAASDFSSGLYIRGGSPDQTLILLDRTTVYNPSHFFGFFSTFNPDAIKDVRLYKGGYPAEYGGRLGSVLTIYNKDGNRKETAGSATVGLLASRASIEGPYKKGSWMFAVRRSTLEPLLAGLRQSVDNSPSKFYFYDVNGKVNFDANANNKFSLAFYAGQDRVTFPFTDDAVFELDYGNQTVSGNWTHIFSEKLFSNTVVTGSRYFNYPDFDLAGTPFRRENNIYDFSLKSDLEYLPNNDHRLKMGFWSGIFTFNLNDIFDDRTTFQSRIQNQYASFYVQDEWRPSDRWILTPGVRFNYFSDGDYIRVEPRMAAEYRPNKRIRLQGAYGRYNQFITLISNEAFSGFDVWLTSAEGVSPAYGDQFVVGAKTIPFTDYGLDIEFYYRSMNDLFELDPFLPDVGGLPYQDVFRFGEGYAYGAEVFFEKRAGPFTGFLGYTLAYTWRKFPGFNAEISNQEQTARFYPPKYDRRHDINAVGNYQLSDRWKFTGSFSFATGQSYTKVLGRYVQYDLPWTNEDRNAFTVGKVNASRLPNYHRLDISFSRSGRFFNLGDSELQLQIINVYSRRNTWFYNFDFNENPIEINAVNMLPILPSISYTVNF
ncbi:TonB-dependent receptor [Gracilimonas sp. Q87]|uniref:TonB-dependent receptor n=1 Tax=Gracilimonas sp. Q87 TaxID=3384766 RepID=UPI00398434F3